MRLIIKTFIVIKIMFIVILLVGCKPSVKDGLTYDEYVKMAKSYRNDSDFDRAIEAGKKAVNIKPNEGEAHYLLGVIYYEAYRKSYDDALKQSLMNAFLTPGNSRNSDPKIDMERYGLKPELNTLSIQEFNETVKYDPKNWWARYSIGTDLFNNKKYSEAIVEFKLVTQLSPSYANGHSLLGASYLKTGKFTLAIPPLTKAVSLDPGVENYYLLGTAYKNLSNWEKVREISLKLKDADKMRYDRLMDSQNIYPWGD